MDETFTTEYETISEKLKKQYGYKVGVVTTVNLNHATPAAYYAHQASRKNYYEIGLEMVESDFDYFADSDSMSYHKCLRNIIFESPEPTNAHIIVRSIMITSILPVASPSSTCT